MIDTVAILLLATCLAGVTLVMAADRFTPGPKPDPYAEKYGLSRQQRDHHIQARERELGIGPRGAFHVQLKIAPPAPHRWTGTHGVEVCPICQSWQVDYSLANETVGLVALAEAEQMRRDHIAQCAKGDRLATWLDEDTGSTAERVDFVGKKWGSGVNVRTFRALHFIPWGWSCAPCGFDWTDMKPGIPSSTKDWAKVTCPECLKTKP